MKDSEQNCKAIHRLKSMLDYAEQLIRLDESVAKKLNQHRLADGTQLIIHEHEFANLPGFYFDKSDEEGPIWLRVERLMRTRAVEPPTEISEWIVVSNDPEKPCGVVDVLHKRVAKKEKNELFERGEIDETEFQVSLSDEPDKSGQPQYFDLAMSLDRRSKIRDAIDLYRAEQWTPWAEVERPRRRSIAIYQKLFIVAQTLSAGNAEQSELVWGIGLTKWMKAGREVDLPLLTRSVEIQIREDLKAEIVIRPRDLSCQIELRAFQDFARSQFNLAEDAARRMLKTIEAVELEGVSPFRSETFEPILKQCATQLDPECRYI